MTYEESLDYLYRRLPIFQRQGKAAYKADLDNTWALMDHFDHPERKFKSVHIAGTNGKGTSAHAMAAILQSAGYRVGLYTSPHLKSFTERIRINGVEVDQSFVADFVSNSTEVIERINPSFFEVTVAMAFCYFAEREVDVAIIETGLGGRLDSTNVITPLVSLITNIGLDHTDLLGNTIPEIAREKAGIIKPGVSVVIGETQAETTAIFDKIAEQNQSTISYADQTIQVEEMDENLLISSEDFGNLIVRSDIKADYFKKNLSGVIEVIRQLKSHRFLTGEKAIKQGLLRVYELTGLKGRFQSLGESPKIIADVSHNAEGLTNLFKQLNRIEFDQLHLIYGAVADKDVSSSIKSLPDEAKLYLTESNVPRSMKVPDLELLVERHGLKAETFQNANLALDAARSNAKKEDCILITGSTFVVAEIEEL